MHQRLLNLTVSLQDEVDDVELDRLTREMRSQIAVLDVEEVRLAPGAQPEPDTKAVDSVILGGIVMSLASGGVFNALIDLFKSWVLRREGREIIVEAKVDGKEFKVAYKGGASSEEVARFASTVRDILEHGKASASGG